MLTEVESYKHLHCTTELCVFVLQHEIGVKWTLYGCSVYFRVQMFLSVLIIYEGAVIIIYYYYYNWWGGTESLGICSSP
jgi:hypothetical protein